jgi:hypothetical protein
MRVRRKAALERKQTIRLNTKRKAAGKAALKVPRLSDTLEWPKACQGDKARYTSTLHNVINPALRAQFIGIYAKDADIARALASSKKPVNLFAKDLHRVFSGGPHSGGRFVGAHWLTLPGELRKHIRMSAPGKPPAQTVEIDYQALHFQMLYAEEKAVCVGDPYLLYPKDPKRSKTVRPAAKHVSLLMLNADSRESAKRPIFEGVNAKRFKKWHEKNGGPWPKDPSEKMALMWPGCPPIDTLMDDIEKRHPAIKHHLCTGAARRLMFKDSAITERIMLSMIEKHGVAPLPVHDSYIVRYDYAEALRASMLEAYADVMGSDIKLDTKALVTPAKPVTGEIPRTALHPSLLEQAKRDWAAERKAYRLYFSLFDAWANALPADARLKAELQAFTDSDTLAAWNARHQGAIAA